jgi:hypothetical protein
MHVRWNKGRLLWRKDHVNRGRAKYWNFKTPRADERREMIPDTFSLPYGQAALAGVADLRG